MNTIKAVASRQVQYHVKYHQNCMDWMHLVVRRTCPICGKQWLESFVYISAAENCDMYPYDTEPYEEQRYLDECCSQKCYDVAQYNTYFYNPDTYKLSDEAAKENTLVDSYDLPF